MKFEPCADCPQWAQWKVELSPETKQVKFLCGRHAENFRKENPTAKVWFCGAVPLNVSA